MASSDFDEGPEQDCADFYLVRPGKVSDDENKNIFAGIAQFLAVFDKKQQGDDGCGIGRSRQVRFVSTPTTTPLTRSSGDKCTSNAEPDDPPGIRSQEQESKDDRTVYETDVGFQSILSKRVSFTEEIFVPCYEISTQEVSSECPRFKAQEARVSSAIAPPSSLERPNFKDILRRVSVVVYKHIKICEQQAPAAAQFSTDKAEMFDERHFRTPTLRYNFIQPPAMAIPGHVFTLEEVHATPKPPDVQEIYDFVTNVFVKACLSSECSVICLIYVERLMKLARVPLLGSTWKPILLCACLLASKMWQDLSSWNGEFAIVYPEYTVDKIDKLEVQFLRALDWDLCVSSSLYAKYYFALRSMSRQEKFRRCYNTIVQRDSAQTSKAPDEADVMLSKSL